VDHASFPPTELVVCAIIGFVALRQYGELLARYDPLT
jgi:hypothetical protein